MNQSEQINELAAALAKAQGGMKNAAMNRTNPHFKSSYADLASVLDAIRVPLSSAGLSVVQTMQSSERGMVLRTTLMHASGQYISTEYPLPVTQKPHEMGSALTYARRYSLAALVCNSSDEDDDGNAAMVARPNGNGNGSAISEQELEALRGAIDEIGADIPKLCGYFKIAALKDITTEMLPHVYSALNAKRARAA
ncbi:MAG TPA: ERF family protein [Pseudolabrys sp.]|nr:ERF family protein [Pseudolabrys sp.]